MIRVLKVFIFLTLIIAPPCIEQASAQEGASHKVPSRNKNPKALKEKKRKEKEIKRAEEEARNKHLGIQDKKTRKRMKRNRKMTQAQYDNKKQLFITRWFTRKR